MVNEEKLALLRKIITENLRVQRDNVIDYVNVGTALQDACSKQNHAIFARRGCGKTLLLHHSTRALAPEVKSVYLNCEDFKRHSFPNVLIEILSGLFRELERNLQGWFGKKKRSKQIIRGIIKKFEELQRAADNLDEDVTEKMSSEKQIGGEISPGPHLAGLSLGLTMHSRNNAEVERSFQIHTQKLQELDRWLPELKSGIRDFFQLSKTTRAVILQVDDLYHLKRDDQAFVVDYIHRLCKDIPLFFKIATLRHVSTLYMDREGQPIGAQERHDYQPINIDYSFGDFHRTRAQNWEILEQFGRKAGLTKPEIQGFFKGEGFSRLVMSGGGVPRDVLSLFLEILSDVSSKDGRIGKDEVRISSKMNFERKIEELKQDCKRDEQDDLLKGIYIIREFCLEVKSNLFLVEERLLQQNDALKALLFRLLDYRIIHQCAAALTHKSQPGTYQAFAIDIGCYAHLRKLQDKFDEIDVSVSDAKERMRSASILTEKRLSALVQKTPANVEPLLLDVE